MLLDSHQVSQDICITTKLDQSDVQHYREKYAQHKECDGAALMEALLDVKSVQELTIARTHTSSGAVGELVSDEHYSERDATPLQDISVGTNAGVIRFCEVDKADVERDLLPLATLL